MRNITFQVIIDFKYFAITGNQWEIEFSQLRDAITTIINQINQIVIELRINVDVVATVITRNVIEELTTIMKELSSILIIFQQGIGD